MAGQCTEHQLQSHRIHTLEETVKALSKCVKDLEANDIAARRDKVWIVGLLAPVMAIVQYFVMEWIKRPHP